MKTLYILFFIAAMTACLGDCYCQEKNDSIPFTITLLATKAQKRADLDITMKIKNLYSNLTLKLPYFSWTGYKVDPWSNSYFIIEKKTDSGYIQAEWGAADIDPVLTNEPQFRYLNYDSVTVYDNNLFHYFKPTSGFYRVKAILLISLLNGNLKDICTDWVSFEVLDGFKRFPR